MALRIFVVEKGRLEYKLVGRGGEVVLLLPPGVGDMRHFVDLENIIKDKKLLFVNLPGVGKSWMEYPTIVNISNAIVALLDDLKLDKISIIAESYGGGIAIDLCQKVAIQKLELIVSGEYFDNWKRAGLKLIFWLPAKLCWLQSWYARIITKFGLIDFGEFANKQLENITQRWWEILSYKLPNLKSEVPVDIIMAKKDGILRSGSEQKLKEMFTNSEVSYFDGGHFGVYKEVIEKGSLERLIGK